MAVAEPVCPLPAARRPNDGLPQNEVLIMFKLLLQDESGAQVVEYALVIAVISILLVVALQPLVTDTGISDLVDLFRTCLGGVNCG
jgi:pilus assembly protein Flp/PilA